MPSRQEYGETLDRLLVLLKRAPLTAREIAEKLGCSKPVAYARVRALQEVRGAQVYTLVPKRRTRGPKPIAYGVR